MTHARRTSRARWLLPAALAAATGLLLLGGGCPGGGTGTDTSDDGQTDGAAGGTSGGATGSSSTGGTGGSEGNSGTGGTESGSGGTTSSGSGIENTGSSGTGTNDSSGSTGGTDGQNNGGESNQGNQSTTPAPTSVSLTEIARTGGTVPGQAGAVTFTAFGVPVIDDKGRIAFWATYAGSGALGSAGLYVWDGQLKLVVHNDPANKNVPDHSPAAYFGLSSSAYKPFDQPLAWGGGDRLLFACDITDGTSPSFNMRGVYRWRASDGHLARVADFEQLAANYSDVKKNSSNFPMYQATFRSLGVSDGGLAVIGLDYGYINTSGGASFYTTGTGVYVSTGTVSLLADSVLSSQQPGNVPEQSADTYFAKPASAVTINKGGEALFQSSFASDAGNSGRGAYLRSAGKLYRVIDSRAGASWPGLPSGAQAGTTAYRLAIGPGGDVAIGTKLTSGGGTSDAVLLFDRSTGQWSSLTGPNGTAASHLLSGVNDDRQVVLLAGGNPCLSSSAGQTQLNAVLPAQLQGASLTWAKNGSAVENDGAAISNHGRAAVPYTYADGATGLAFWTGEQLLVVCDTKLGVPAGLTQFSTVVGSENDRPGRSGMLSDADEIVFRATLSDNSQAIYKAKGQ